MIKSISTIPRFYKNLIMAVFDSVALIGILLTSFTMRYGYWYWPKDDLIWVIFGAPIVAIPIFIQFGLYRTMVRYLGFTALYTTTKAVSLYALVWGIIGFMSAVNGIHGGIPRSVIIINWVLAILLIGGSRVIAKSVLNRFNINNTEHKGNIIIYGAGSAGRQLSNALMQSKEFRPIAHIDDSSELQKQIINGIKVYKCDEVGSLVTRYKVKEVLLAIPSISRQRRNEIINLLEPYPVTVRILPGVSEIAQGKVQVQDFREVKIDDLLGRDSVHPDQALLEKNIRNKVVMVTGAGGSIGSELCRHIIKLGSSKLILIERSELGLYLINKEISNIGMQKHVVPILGSVSNQDRIERICLKYNVETIYHAAAYKHVPIVELNDIEGAKNNIFGTLNCAQAAINCNVETFVLISTDKAVRPTNTMGATKRFSELILQALSREQQSTVFCMVRFGNVLGSSGSVIPLFKEQIEQGGPVTVTDINIVRYFMTISESVDLVIQAGAMSSSGDVFVLDMGEPVLINELAKKIIHLSGLQIKNINNPNGDIEIIYTGLRPGEKLYEELLIGDNISKTEHPMIMRENEEMLSWEEVKSIMVELEVVISDYDNEKLREILMETLPTFKPQSDISDLLYN